MSELTPEPQVTIPLSLAKLAHDVLFRNGFVSADDIEAAIKNAASPDKPDPLSASLIKEMTEALDKFLSAQDTFDQSSSGPHIDAFYVRAEAVTNLRAALASARAYMGERNNG